ncbi:hypothetical protein HDV00_007426 [Rhizophlyctis rosea]|nr:hypothetical protein HDV00_007426 [Rhizophlyctis rosea]
MTTLTLLPELIRQIALWTDPQTLRRVRRSSKQFHSLISPKDLVVAEARWRYSTRGVDDYFSRAARNGHIHVMKTYFATVPIYVRSTAFLSAAKAGNVPALRFLTDQHKTFTRQHYHLALDRAVEEGHAGVVRFLLPIVLAHDTDVGTWIREAARMRHREVVVVLANAVTEGKARVMDQKDLDWGLFAAARAGYVDMVTSLLAAGADVNSEDGYALHCAKFRDYVGVVKALLEAGANIGWHECLTLRTSCVGYMEIVEMLFATDAPVRIYIIDDEVGIAATEAYLAIKAAISKIPIIRFVWEGPWRGGWLIAVVGADQLQLDVQFELPVCDRVYEYMVELYG